MSRHASELSAMVRDVWRRLDAASQTEPAGEIALLALLVAIASARAAGTSALEFHSAVAGAWDSAPESLHAIVFESVEVYRVTEDEGGRDDASASQSG